MIDPDLTGTIIVLTHPRTGSSLVMQTLALLGVDVMGERDRADLPGTANPRGYFEDRALLRDGLHAAALAADPAALRGRAVKFGLGPLVARRSDEEWRALAERGASLLLPIRSPFEVLRSREVLLRGDLSKAARVRLFRASVRGYLLDLAYIAARAQSAAPHCIDHGRAIREPERYVAQVASAAGRRPSPSQRDAAIANIDTSLYRARRAGGGGAPAAAGIEPLEVMHEVLRGDDPRKWERVRALLPPWAFDAPRGLAL